MSEWAKALGREVCSPASWRCVPRRVSAWPRALRPEALSTPGGLGRYWAAQWHLARAVGKRFRGCRAKRLYVHQCGGLKSISRSASTWFPWSKSSHDKGMLGTLQETLGHRPAQCSCCATDRKDRHDCSGCKAEGAQVLICKHCESKHWIDHKLVTPINSERTVQCKTSSVEASRRASPPGLRVRKTNSRPCIRVDKVQGSRETISVNCEQH